MTRTLLHLFLCSLTLALSACSTIQQKRLFHPTHHGESNGLAKWEKDGQVIGYCRTAKHPRNVWLMLHGNLGQAADRTYAMPLFSPTDSVFVLEYPGFGQRRGTPSTRSLNAAAASAYRFLRESFPTKPICVAAESLGSGPACSLAGESPPPDKIVLAVPFDELTKVAAEHVNPLFAKIVLGSTWNNVRSLENYHGRLEIYGAADDRLIPVAHARTLAASVPQSRFHLLHCGHGEWYSQPGMKFRNP